MTDAPSARAPTHRDGTRWLTAFASLAVGAAFLALWFWLLPRMARFQRGNGGRGTLAMAGSGSVRAGIRGCLTLHLGLRMDGTRHSCPCRPTAAISSGGFLSLRAEPHVRGLCSRLGRTVGDSWAQQPGNDHCRRSGCPWRAISFVVFYEEPTLRKKFGVEYEEYCRNVRRWWPRVRGWDKP